MSRTTGCLKQLTLELEVPQQLLLRNKIIEALMEQQEIKELTLVTLRDICIPC